jgi:flagella basal body P-ring formation protein FlgA
MLRRLPVFALLLAAATGLAGEVQLRGFHEARGTLVRLGDVAEFHGVSEEQRTQIEQLPLFPAPQTGIVRKLSAQDVRETMSLYGLSLPTLRITGECRIQGTGEAEPAKSDNIELASATISEPEPPASTADQLAVKLIAYLQSKDRIRTQWTAKPLLTKPQQDAISAMQRPEVAGGQSPWTGRQAFNVRDRAAMGAKAVTFKADVERIAQAWTAKRNLAAGDVVGEDDVELSEINPNSLTSSVVVNIDDAVGLEVKQPIAAGQIVQTLSLRRPLVVKRGELITVLSVAAGVQVKATAKALAEAALGDVILLEAVETKKQFQGRVTGPQEAMVFVDSAKVAADAPAAVVQKSTRNKLR